MTEKQTPWQEVRVPLTGVIVVFWCLLPSMDSVEVPYQLLGRAWVVGMVAACVVCWEEIQKIIRN